MLYLVYTNSRLPRQSSLSKLDDVSELVDRGWILVLPLNITDVSHHNIDYGILDQTEEHEQCAGGHKHVNSLEMRNCY